MPHGTPQSGFSLQSLQPVDTPTMSSVPPSHAQTTTAQSVATRGDLVRLGQSGRPWEFLGPASQALAQAPQDHGIRFLAAANLARLGLKTLAAEQIAALPDVLHDHGDVRGLIAALSALPDDKVHDAIRLATARANLEACSARRWLTQHWDGWASALAEVNYYKSLDGNVVRRPVAAIPGELRACSGLFDHRTLAKNAATQLATSAQGHVEPVLIEGVDPPWVAREAWAATAKDMAGYRPWMLLLAADPNELLDGISLLDLREMLSDTRVELIAGSRASLDLEELLLKRADYALPKSILTIPTCRTRISPPLGSVLERVLVSQGASCDTLAVQVRAHYDGCDSKWWAARFEDAARGGRPLRVLIPTTRYSTFVKHAAEDLGSALTRLGCETKTMIEPDATSRFASVAYHREMAEFRPDLVVLINYPRSSLGDAIPAGVPVVCWLQDGMPHLFDASLGATQTGLDFLCGHLFPELFSKFGFDRSRAFAVPIVADAHKFHDGAPAADLVDKLACEVALVSHHSETPRAMHERLRREAASVPALVRAIDALWDDAQRVTASSASVPPHAALSQAVSSRLRDAFGQEPDAALHTRVLRQYALPVSDRLLRHETLAWAAEICARRGWRMHLYGRGWEKHPTLAGWARGELAHDESLRAAYRSASAHLHISMTTLAHQRVAECALAGGLMLCRLQRDALAGPKAAVEHVLLTREPDAVNEMGWLGYTVADHAETMAFASLRGRLGFPLTEPHLWIRPERAASLRAQAGTVSRAIDAGYLLGDLAELTFTTAEGLEACLLRSVSNHAWRTGASAMVRERVKREMTTDVLADRMVRFVTERLGGDRAMKRSGHSPCASEAA